MASIVLLQDENGEKTSWAGWHAVPNDQLYGPEGWCGAKEPAHRCAQMLAPLPCQPITSVAPSVIGGSCGVSLLGRTVT